MVVTGIFKEAVTGRVAVRRLNLEGDRQADLSVHGGSEKAVYAYPAEYYPFWQEQFPEMELPWGMFGENLTVAGLLDETVHIGDCFQVGSAHLVVTQPRLPCYKLGLKFGRDDILKRFLQSELTGFYFAVLKEGEVAAGDPISLLHHERITIVLKKCPGSVRERKKYLCNTCFLYRHRSHGRSKVAGTLAGSIKAAYYMVRTTVRYAGARRRYV